MSSTPNTAKASGPPPRHPAELLHHAERTANTTFRDRHPDVPPLALEPRRCTTRPPAAQAARSKPLADHSPPHQHPGPPPRRKSQPPPLRRVNRVDNLVAQATQDRHPSHEKQLPHPMKPLPTLVPEAATSAHKHQPLGAAAPTSPNLPTRRTHIKAGQGLQDDASRKVTT